MATSGVTRRAGPAATTSSTPDGPPGRTGIVQVTPRRRTGLVAEVRAKSALLAGPGGAAAHLPDGGLFVTADGGGPTVGAIADHHLFWITSRAAGITALLLARPRRVRRAAGLGRPA